MTTSEKRKAQTRNLAMGAIMTAFVIVLQTICSVTTWFGPFSTAVGLIPIVIGAALCGVGVGTWLGFVFATVVLLLPNPFYAFSVIGTIITVLVKGIMCGLVAGLIYKLLAKLNQYIAVISAALLCPITNTAFFLLGCYVFFIPHAEKIAEAFKMTQSGMALFWAIAMGNFIFEILTNVILSPVIVRVLKFAKK